MYRVVTPAEAQKLLSKGWKAADLHVHTTHSYDVMPVPELDPEHMYALAKHRGMGFVTFTDHDTFTAHEQFKKPDLVTGAEIKVFDKKHVGYTVHVNVFCMTKQQFLELEYIANEVADIYEFTSYLKKHKLPYVYNHPYWAEPGEWCNHRSVERIAPLFPVIELNIGRIRAKNDLALRLAKRHKKGIVSGSDSHSGEHCCVYTLAPGKTFKEWWSNVEKGNAAVVRQDLTLSSMVAEINRRIEEVFSPHLREAELAKFAKYHTGVRLVDRITSLLFAARKHWFGRYLLKHAMLLISRSRIPTALYLHNERRHVKRIKADMEAAS